MNRLPKMFLLTLPFILLGAFFLYLGTEAMPWELTDDGYPLDIFYYAMGAWFIGLSLVLVLGLVLFFRFAEKRQANFIEKGLKGHATILATEQTGVFINENPQVQFRLQVEIPGRPPYEVQHKQVVELIKLWAIAPGSVHAVYVDPDNDRNLLMELGTEQTAK